MSDYTELVKALRCMELRLSCNECEYGVWSESGEAWGCEFERKNDDAAAAIEALEAELTRISQELPKRGKWIEDEETYPSQGLSNYKCSLCGKFCGTWRRGLKADQLPNFCGNCGAKMEVQE